MAKKKKNPGDDFEDLSKFLFDIVVEKSPDINIEGPKVFLDGPEGKREFDLVIRTEAFNQEYLTVIECRDYKTNRLDVTHLDGFHSKMIDVGASKGVLVTRKGFSPKAIQKAKRLGVSLFLAGDKDSITTDLLKDGLGVPILVSEVKAVTVGFRSFDYTHKGSEHGPNDIKLQLNMRMNDAHPVNIVRDAILNQVIEAETCTEGFLWDPAKDLKEAWIRDTAGNKHPVNSYELFVCILSVEHYFGYLHNLPNAKFLTDFFNGTTSGTLNTKDLLDQKFESYLTRIYELEQVPSNCIKVISLPDQNFVEGNQRFELPAVGKIYFPNNIDVSMNKDN